MSFATWDDPLFTWDDSDLTWDGLITDVGVPTAPNRGKRRMVLIPDARAMAQLPQPRIIVQAVSRSLSLTPIRTGPAVAPQRQYTIVTE